MNRKLVNICLIATWSFLVLFFNSCETKNSQRSNFKRIPFKIDINQTSIPLKFNKKKYSWNKTGKSTDNIFGKYITSGIGIEIKKRNILKISPKSNGKKALTFTFFTYSFILLLPFHSNHKQTTIWVSTLEL